MATRTQVLAKEYPVIDLAEGNPSGNGRSPRHQLSVANRRR
jgi:hypothetical protein